MERAVHQIRRELENTVLTSKARWSVKLKRDFVEEILGALGQYEAYLKRFDRKYEQKLRSIDEQKYSYLDSDF